MTASASVVDWQDRAEGLESDLRSAVQVAYKRGAREWARLNYPDWIEWLERSTPQPAEQDAREAVARVIFPETDRVMTDREWGGDSSYSRAAWKVALAKADAILALTQAAPDGWRLVPVEPTPEMIEAACGEGKDHPLLKYLTSEERSGPAIFPLSTWRAMLSTSPAPPAQGSGS